MSLAPIDFIETNDVLTKNESEIKKEEGIDDVPEPEGNMSDGGGSGDKSKCGEIFAVHSGNFILICAFCNAQFDNMQMFGLHIRHQHEGKLSPKVRRDDVANYSDESRSGESVALTSESASDSHQFSDDEWATRPQQADVDGQAVGPSFSCDTCTRKYDSKKLLRRHQRSTGCKQKLPPIDLALFCIPCNRQFKSKRKFRRHKQKHKDGKKLGSMDNNSMMMGAEMNNPNVEHNQQQQQTFSSSSGNSVVTTNQQHHTQMHYQGSAAYTSELTTPVNNLVNSYSQTVPIDSTVDQSVYDQGLVPTQPHGIHHMATRGSTSSSSNSTVQNQSTQSSAAPQKRKRSPQSDENFIRALEAVRTGGIGFCKAARIYGVNNRTLWLEYKKRGYPISRPSIMNRNTAEPDISPTPPPPPPQPPSSSTPTIEKSTMDIYDHINQPSINMEVPPTSETATPMMCPPQAHPMGLLNFLDSRHMEFSSNIHTMMSRQRYNDSAVNEDTGAMNLHDPDFNSM